MSVQLWRRILYFDLKTEMRLAHRSTIVAARNRLILLDLTFGIYQACPVVAALNRVSQDRAFRAANVDFVETTTNRYTLPSVRLLFLLSNSFLRAKEQILENFDQLAYVSTSPLPFSQP